MRLSYLLSRIQKLAALSLALCPATAWSQDQTPPPAAPAVPIASNSVLLPEDAQPCPVDCSSSLLPPWNWHAALRAGSSYYDVPGESLWGGTYGLELAYRLWGPFAAWSNLSVNHVSHGTQVLGTVGLVKAGIYNPDSLASRLSALVLFDQYTDTRINGLYLSQCRFMLGYALTESVEVGAFYHDPMSGDNGVLFFDPLLGFNTGSLQLSQSVGAYAGFRVGDFLLTGTAAYQEVNDALVLGAGSRVNLTEDVGAYANAMYLDSGAWGGSVGLEFRFGGACQRSGEACCAAARSDDVVRGGGPKKVLFKAQLGEIMVQNLGLTVARDFETANLLAALSLGGSGEVVGTNLRGQTFVPPPNQNNSTFSGTFTSDAVSNNGNGTSNINGLFLGNQQFQGLTNLGALLDNVPNANIGPNVPALNQSALVKVVIDNQTQRVDQGTFIQFNNALFKFPGGFNFRGEFSGDK